MIIQSKLEKTEERFNELEKLLADPQIIANQSRYQKLAKEYSDLTPIVATYREYRQSLNQFNELKSLLEERHDRDFEDLAKIELEDLKRQQEQLTLRLEELINPSNQQKSRDLIIEIRAGTGGEEASLFAADLYRMYTRYAEKKGWKVESIDS